MIINLILGMDKSIDNPTPAVNPPLNKNKRDQLRKKDLYYSLVIGSLNFLMNSTLPKTQFWFINARVSSLIPSFCTIKPLNGY